MAYDNIPRQIGSTIQGWNQGLQTISNIPLIIGNSGKAVVANTSGTGYQLTASALAAAAFCGTIQGSTSPSSIGLVPVLNALGDIDASMIPIHFQAWSTITNTPTTLGGYGIVDAVNINGGSMTGPLLLSNDPTLNLGAATKQYVDSKVSGAITNAVIYKGTVDITATPPATPLEGYLYRVTTGGAPNAGYGFNGSAPIMDVGDYVVYNGTSWDHLSNTNPVVSAGTGIGVSATGDTSFVVSLLNTTVTGAGTAVGSTSVVPVITYNAQGQLTGVTTATITPASIGAAPASHTQAWTTITSTPTTIAGYGIVDAMPKNTILSVGTGLQETNGGTLSAGVTISIANTITAGNAGSSSVVPVITYNAQGQLTGVNNATITPSTIGALPNTLVLTAGTGLSETNGGTLASGVTISITNTGVTGSIAGSSSVVPVISYNPQGQLTGVTNATITPSSIGAVPTTTSVLAGTGLSGGGTLSSNVTLNIANTTVTGAGTAVGSTSVVPVITYNAQGQLTGVTTATITPASIGAAPASHTQAWTTITSTPTTIAGYGIVDAMPKNTILSVGTGLQETNGGTLSAGVTISIANTITAGGPTGSSSVVPVITYNAQGQLTTVSTATISPSTIGVDYSLVQNITTVTGSYSVLSTDHVICVNNSASCTITLPTGVVNKTYLIKNIAGNSSLYPITIAAQSGQTIDGSASKNIDVDYESRTVIFIGNNSWIFV